MDTQSTSLLENGKSAWSRGNFLALVITGLVGALVALVVAGISVGAAMEATDSAVEEEVIMIEATPAAMKVEYYLPYPGILPDNPLYKLKMVRDRLKLWMTFNESDKAKLELAYADKRINAAMALAAGNKMDLAVTTATKAEKYLEQSTNRVIKLIKTGQDEKSQLLNLEKAVSKHLEVLEEISTRAEDKHGKAFGESIMVNKLMGERVGQVLMEESE